MVHVSVGTANALCGVFNAARENVPILFTAGRSPLTEERASRRARHLHPLGAGDVRPGRHAARDGQMGIRAAQRRAARNRGRPRADDRDQPARGAGLSVAAARGAGGAAARLLLRQPVAPGGGRRRRRPTRRRSPRRRDSWRAAKHPVIVTAECRARPAAVRGARRIRRALRDPGRRAPPAASVACRPTIPAISATTRRPSRRTPTRSSSSNATCRGSRAARRRRPSARSSISASTRCSAAIRSAAFPCDVAITGAPRLALPELGAALTAARPTAAMPTRRQPLAERREAHARRLARSCATRRRRMRPLDPAWVSACLAEARDPEDCDPRQRIHAAARALPVDPARRAISGRARRRGSAGAPARRSASSSPSPTGR